MILIAITMFSIAFWGNNKKNRKDFSIVFEESSINNYLQTYLESEFCAVAISNYEENSIQGEIYDMSLGGNLFVTKALFNYNVESNKLDIYEYNEKNRILKYYISDNKIYASVIKDIDIEDNLFNWELVSYDLNFKNKNLLPTASTPLIYLCFLKSYNYTPTNEETAEPLRFRGFLIFPRLCGPSQRPPSAASGTLWGTSPFSPGNACRIG